jgi:heparanase 1
MLNVDLNNKMINNAVLEFNGNAHLRLGGSLGDFVVYNIGNVDGFCQYPYGDFSPPTNATHAGYDFFSGCLEMTRWDEINAFVERNKVDMLFGIAALFGRNMPGPCPEGTNCRFQEDGQRYGFDPCCTNWTGLWDNSNAELFIRYTQEKGYKIWAWELGNELVGEKGIDSHINVTDYLQDWQTFMTMLGDIYGSNRPKVVVPDTTWCDWFGEFLPLVPDDLKPDIVTHHLYSLGAGSDPNVWTKTLNATYLDQVKTLAAEVNAVVSLGSPNSSIWLGEAGGAYNSGRDNVTNSFNSGFWFLDQMGIFAANGHGAYCRQTLVGGHYSLLDYFTYEPNADYYSLLLWSRLMGKNVLATFAASQEPIETDLSLRAYSHCSSSGHGGVTVLLINLSNTTSVNIDNISLDASGRNLLSSSRREEYIFSSASDSTVETDILISKKVKLNGQPLEVSEDFNIPALKPSIVQHPQPSMVMQPLTYGFVVFPHAGVSICQ